MPLAPTTETPQPPPLTVALVRSENRDNPLMFRISDKYLANIENHEKSNQLTQKINIVILKPWLLLELVLSPRKPLTTRNVSAGKDSHPNFDHS